MKILVADDDPVSRRMMQAVLQRHGYEVVVVADGITALETLSAPNAPRLALLDWMMPGMDGPSVCRRARRLQGGSYIYIMLLTSKQSGEDIVTGLQAGAGRLCHQAVLPRGVEGTVTDRSEDSRTRR